MEIKLAAGLNFGPFYMDAFDPYETLYQSEGKNNLRKGSISL